MKITYVVGEMFSNCEQLDNFVCFKNWHQLFGEKCIEDIIFLPGQGLTQSQRDLVTATCRKDYARILTIYTIHLAIMATEFLHLNLNFKTICLYKQICIQKLILIHSET